MIRLLHRLRDCRSGVAMTEFALAAPLLFGAGLGGIETANLAITQMQISQTAIHIADNASRVGDISTLENRKVYESDINDVFLGSNLQAGRSINLFDHGRVIVSSLEVVPGTDDQQYIHWQRCKGVKHHLSTYGHTGDGLDGSLAGMGPPGEEIYALEGEAVIFVEISYDYQPLVGRMFSYANSLSATAAFNVRDSRDLSQLYQRDATNPDEVSSCNTYDNFDDSFT